MKNFKIAVAGTGYVGLSIATLLSQHNSVLAIDVIPKKVELINNKKSPIADKEIEEYLSLPSVLISHSKTYKENYFPHYLVINMEYLDEIIN